MLVIECFGVFFGGAAGCLARFFFSRWAQAFLPHREFPWGIWLCNVLGCLLAGLLVGYLSDRLMGSAFWRAALYIGFLGGFTTFSSFSMDTIFMFHRGDILAALSNILLTVVTCLLATLAGFSLMKAVSGV